MERTLEMRLRYAGMTKAIMIVKLPWRSVEQKGTGRGSREKIPLNKKKNLLGHLISISINFICKQQNYFFVLFFFFLKQKLKTLSRVWSKMWQRGYENIENQGKQITTHMKSKLQLVHLYTNKRYTFP